ncbi:MAG TPA: L,D-transpeptidase [Solirubrobacteraceae bacterium]|nr:L,D-transpeptidase [Solirubrobacteraceae bacterium]
MRRTIWCGALVTSLAAAGAGGWLAAPSGASPRPPAPTRMWHGIRIQSLDTVPAQFQNARASTARASTAHTASAATASTTTGTTTTAPAPPPKVTTVVLSNETTFSRWAYTNQIAWIHTQPSATSKHIVRTNWYTPDGFPELYLLLKQTEDSQGQAWVELRVPGRPNGRVGWVQRQALGNFHLTHELIVVNREKTRMYLYRSGHRIWSAPVGVGKRSTPTPPGHFWIRERFKITSKSSGYYPFAFGTTDYSTLTDWPGGGVVGIHGPYYDPQGIPGHISHGCIRLKVTADGWLARHITLGVPVHVV